MSRDKWFTFGTVFKNKGKPGSYIKIKEDVMLHAGDVVQVQDPRDTIDILTQKGHIEADQAAERKAKIPDYVLFDLTLPPAKK